MERLWLVSYGLAWLLVVAQVLTLIALLWAVGRVHLKRAPEAHALITEDGPPIHTELPEFEGRDTTGRLIRSGDYRGRELALLLVSPECEPCEQLAGAIRSVRRQSEDPPEFLLVLATAAEAEAYLQRHRPGCPLIVDEAARIRAVLAVQRTPYGFLIDAAGVIRMKGVVNDEWQLEGLIGRRGRHLGGYIWEASGAAGPAASVGAAEN